MLDRLRSIKQVHAEPDHHLRVVYEDGATMVVDCGPVIRQGGVFAPLADEQVFAQVKVGPRGRSVCWPGDIDFCADALWLQVHEESRRHAG